MEHFNDLIADTYLRESLLSEATLISVTEVLLASAGIDSAHLLVSRCEEDRKKERVEQPSDLPQAVQKVNPPRFGLGSFDAVLMPLQVSFYFSQARKSIPLELNSLGVEVIAKNWGGTTEPHVWLEQLFCDLVVAQSTRYAYACRRGEFHASNIVSDDSGTRAIGRQFGSFLPGLYWLNFFGRECIAAMQESAFQSLSAEACSRLGEGFLVRVAPDPSQWQQDAYAEGRSHCLLTLGPSFFFDRNDQLAETTTVPFDP